MKVKGFCYMVMLGRCDCPVQLKTLHTLTERLRKGGNSGAILPTFFVKKKIGDDDAEPLITAIDDIATEGLRLRDSLDLDLFREHVLKLPVRSVLQLLSSYYQLVADKANTAREAAAEALRAAVLSSLYRLDIDVDRIAEGDLHAVIEAAFNLCQLDGEPDTAIYLRPQSRNASVRNACVSLAADVARLCEHDPAKAITYMVVMAGSSNILNLARATPPKRQSTRGTGDGWDENALRRKVKQYLSVGRKDNALNWALHATAALVSVSHTSGLQLRQGIIGVRSKGGTTTFHSCLTKALSLGEGHSYPAIAFSRSAVKRPSNTQRYLSIFNTLGLISNLLDLDVTDELIGDQVRKQLNKTKSVQTVSVPNWDGLDARNEVVDTEAGDSEQDEQAMGDFDGFEERVTSWLTNCQQLRQHFHPSAVLMGKIWNRLYFSLDNISAAMRVTAVKDRCCKSMELFAWALINACLVEEVDYHHRYGESGGVTLNRDNPRTSGVVVIKKFECSASNNVSVTPAAAPLAFMIASCPLVLGLIKHDKKAAEFIRGLNAKLNNDVQNFVPILESDLCSNEVWSAIGGAEVSK